MRDRAAAYKRLLGLDRAVIYTLLGRSWGAVAGIVTLLFVSKFFTPKEQGFYYTFSNILAVQVFFELGLSLVILQFASHEKAHLHWTDRGTLEGCPIAKARLSSLLRVSLAWYGVVALLIIIALLPAGLRFFSTHNSGTGMVWRAPWVWLVLVTGATSLTSPIFSILEGCGLVAHVAFIRVCQSVIASLSLWAAMYLRLGLFAGPIFSTALLVCGLSMVALRHRRVFIDLGRSAIRSIQISWRHEIWPFQWKIALSWAGGYFIFQLFNPVLFAYHGAVAAGQMGMSLTAMQGISAMAMAWVSTKAAPFGTLVAAGAFDELDRRFFRSARMAFVIAILGAVALWTGAYYLNHIGHPWSHRLLPPLPFALLAGTTVVNSIIFAESVYLRAHKQEPFLGISVLNGLLVGISTYVLGRFFGATGMMAGYFLITLVIVLPISIWIFQSKQRLWHSGNDIPLEEIQLNVK
ncbi:MAG: lipopolysaccharide biosynthesis protein [Armatimonadota bacterium]